MTDTDTSSIIFHQGFPQLLRPSLILNELRSSIEFIFVSTCVISPKWITSYVSNKLWTRALNRNFLNILNTLTICIKLMIMIKSVDSSIWSRFQGSTLKSSNFQQNANIPLRSVLFFIFFIAFIFNLHYFWDDRNQIISLRWHEKKIKRQQNCQGF